MVLFVLNVAGIDNSAGFGKAFVDAVSGVSDTHEFFFFFFNFGFDSLFQIEKWGGSSNCLSYDLVFAFDTDMMKRNAMSLMLKLRIEKCVFLELNQIKMASLLFLSCTFCGSFH